MTDDSTLLRRYALDRSEADFAELVRRHLDFVYSAALRQVNGDAHLAQDVAQLVFTDLARKAAQVAGHPVLAGWLFTSTRFTAAKLVRTARRRQAREQEALLMQENSPDPQAGWERVRPVLDEALAELDEADREAILLRYLRGHDFAEVGAKLSLSANAARMRVDRAVDKLRALLARRGATSTAAALSLALATQGIGAAPAGLAATVTGAALAGAAPAAVLTFMSLTKLHVAVASVALVAGVGFYAVQEKQNAALRAELDALPVDNAEIARLRLENAQFERTARQVATFQVSPRELAELQAAIEAKQQRLQALAKTQSLRPTSGVVRVVPDAETVDINALDARPRPAVTQTPVYPPELAAAGIEGSVVVSFIIGHTGKVLETRAVESTHPGFEAAAVAALEKWQFDPGKKNGRPVNARVSQKIVFELPKGRAVTHNMSDWF